MKVHKLNYGAANWYGMCQGVWGKVKEALGKHCHVFHQLATVVSFKMAATVLEYPIP